jgi:hypothetical protein
MANIVYKGRSIIGEPGVDSLISSVSLVNNFLYSKDLEYFGVRSGSPSISTEQCKWASLGFTRSLKIPTGAWIQINSGGTGIFDGNFTVEGWVYPLSIASDQVILSCSSTGDNFNAYTFLLQVSSGGAVRFAIGNENGTGYRYDQTSVTGVIAANTWSFIQVTVTGTSVSVRLNDNRILSGNLSGAVAHAFSTYRIGRLGAGLDRFYNGYLQGIRITRAARIESVPTAPFYNL